MSMNSFLPHNDKYISLPATASGMDDAAKFGRGRATGGIGEIGEHRINGIIILNRSDAWSVRPPAGPNLPSAEHASSQSAALPARFNLGEFLILSNQVFLIN
jgi:hypothetical protein